jgi:hypothetical protein
VVLVANLVVFGLYFGALAPALLRGAVDQPHFIGLLAKSVALLVVVIVILSIAMAIRSPGEANAPRDEREKLIALKGARVAYVALATTAVAAFWGLIAGLDRFLVANALFLGLVVAEAAQNGVQIVHYRRGA